MSRMVYDALLLDHDAALAMARGSVETVKVIRVDDLHLPIHFALGRFESATQEELDNLIVDLTHERSRR